MILKLTCILSAPLWGSIQCLIIELISNAVLKLLNQGKCLKNCSLSAPPASDAVQGFFLLPWLWGSPDHIGANEGSGLPEHTHLLCSSGSVNWLVQRRKKNECFVICGLCWS